VTNKSKTKHTKVHRNITNLEQDLIIYGQVFEKFQTFRYLGTLINLKNVLHEEIKSSITAGNRCFYSLVQIFRLRAKSKAVKIEIYKTVMKPAVMYGSETWPMTEKATKRLNTWERKILRGIHGPVVEQGLWRIRTNHELWELYKNLATVADIKKTRLEW
jgi:hypothetical protein